MRSLSVVAALSLILGGCAFAWEKRTVATTRQADSPVRLARAELPGTAALTPDGTVRFTVDASSLCQVDRLTVKRRVATKYYGWSKAGLVEAGLGIVLGVAGIYGGVTTDEPAPFLGVGITSLVFTGVLATIRYAAPGAPKQVEDTGDWPVVDRTDTVPCSPEITAGYASLTLVLPWGTVAAAPVVDGVATFAVDWTDAPAAPDAALASPWPIRADRAGLMAAFTPSTDDVAQVIALGAQWRDRVVVGSSPASLQVDAFQVEGAGLQVGGAGLLTVTVSNPGGSTAVDVVGKTRSTLKGLDGVAFAFGKIQPGRSATRTVTVKVPAKIDDDKVLVKLVVSAPDVEVESSLTIPLSRSVCPAGGLTREAYDTKRARLKAARDAGAITAAEFDEYDAALLSCLK